MIYTAPRASGLSNLGMPWTRSDLERLEQLVRSGLPAGQIALRMERSTVAIRSKAAALGWRLRGRRRGPPPGAGGAA